MVTSEIIYIFQEQTTNITTARQLMNFTSNKVQVSIWGTWDGASVRLEVETVPTLSNTTNWIVINDRLNIPFVFTEDITVTLTEYVYGMPIRGVIENAGAGTNLNCVLQVI